MPSKLKNWRPSGSLVGLSAARRGYDADWRRLRASFLREWLATKGPFCGLCGGMLRNSASAHVDHVQPFVGVADPRRLARDNLRVLCPTCNSRMVER